MDLREYLFRNRISVTEFSEKVGYGRSYIGEILNNRRKPGRKLAKLIERATNGEVTVEELLEDKE